MTEPTWINSEIAATLHSAVIERFGGADGVRDQGLVEGALAAPLNQYTYGNVTSVFELAAALCRSIVKSHGFVDGNKRSGLMSAVGFLALNGYELVPPEEEVAPMIEGLAAGTVNAEELGIWFEDHCVPHAS